MAEPKGNMSKYLEAQILSHVLRGAAYTAPSTIYVGIVSENATEEELEAGTLTHEVTGYIGNRKSTTWASLSVVDGKTQTVNSQELNFVSVPQTNLEYLIIVDAAAGGNVLWWTKMPSKKFVNAGDTVTINIATLIVNID